MMKREDVLMEALPYIQQFHGKTLVMVTHDPAIAKKAHRTVRIKDGKLEEDKKGALVENGNEHGQ